MRGIEERERRKRQEREGEGKRGEKEREGEIEGDVWADALKSGNKSDCHNFCSLELLKVVCDILDSN